MKQKIFLALFLFLATGVSLAQAATLGVAVDNSHPDINQPVRVDLVLDTQGENANAIQGKIIFPPSLFILQSIDDGSSPVTFWINSPKETASGTVAFAGIMTGGFAGAGRSIVSLVLVPVTSGAGTVSISDISLLRNDGQGSAISVAAKSAGITVSNIVASVQPSAPSSTIAPEPFTPAVASDPAIFDGKYFLVFSTTDKGSGIDHYDVAEIPAGSTVGASSPWQSAESPYLLKDQALASDIYVRAVDHAGNSTIAKLPATHPGIPPIAIAIILVFAAIGILLWRRRRGLIR